MRLDGGGDTGASRKAPAKDKAFALMMHTELTRISAKEMPASTYNMVNNLLKVIAAYIGD